MFIRAPIFYATLIMSLFGTFLYYSLNYYTPHIASVTSSPKPSHPIFHQRRSCVTKDFYICDNEQRYHHRLSAPSSTLHYDPNHPENPLTETLENVEGLFQDSFSRHDDMQQVHSIWAPSATYNYKSRQFQGSQVLISIFSLPGHRLPDRLDQLTPFLEGKASNVSCIFEHSSSILKSDNFKASVNTLYREPS